MNRKEFYEKFGLHFKDMIEEYAFLGALDKLYLEFTEEQALKIIDCFYDNADDIYNDAQQAADEYIKDTVDKLVKIFSENNDEEDEEPLDKVAKA